MENIFLAHLQPTEIYDLKGSWIDRSTNHGLNSGKIMKDMDLKKYIILSSENRYKILKQLERDTMFLSSCNIMDYSLLLGIYYLKIAQCNPMRPYNNNKSPQSSPSQQSSSSNENKLDELVFGGGVQAQIIEGPGVYYMGIIDILQKYTLKKN